MRTTPTGKGTPAVNFYRVSGDRQGDAYSLPSQEKLATEYSLKTGLKVIKSWSEVESASKEEKRTAFFEMVAFVKANNVRHVVFDKVDRAVRGFKSAVIIQDLMEHHGVKFHFTRENLVIDTDSPPSEKLRFYLGTILAKYYIDNLKVEIKKGVTARLLDGHWSYKAPLGYLNWRDPESKRAIVIKDPKIGPAISEIFQKYSTGEYPMPSLIGILKEASGKEHDWHQLAPMLANPFYYGAMSVKGVVMTGKHEPLVTKETFDACQKVRTRRKTKYLRHEQQLNKPFMGLMKCGACGASVTGEVKYKAKAKNYIYYRCANSKCRQKSINTEQAKIHSQLVEAFRPFERFTPRATELFIEAMREQLGNMDAFSVKESDELMEARTALKADCAKLLARKAQGLLSDDECAALVSVKEDALEEIALEIGAHAKADLATYREGLKIIELFTKVSKFVEFGENLGEKAKLAKLVLSDLLLTDGKLRFAYQNPFDNLLKLSVSKGWWALVAEFGTACLEYSTAA